MNIKKEEQVLEEDLLTKELGKENSEIRKQTPILEDKIEKEDGILLEMKSLVEKIKKGKIGNKGEEIRKLSRIIEGLKKKLADKEKEEFYRLMEMEDKNKLIEELIKDKEELERLIGVKEKGFENANQRLIDRNEQLTEDKKLIIELDRRVKEQIKEIGELKESLIVMGRKLRKQAEITPDKERLKELLDQKERELKNKEREIAEKDVGGIEDKGIIMRLNSKIRESVKESQELKKELMKINHKLERQSKRPKKVEEVEKVLRLKNEELEVANQRLIERNEQLTDYKKSVIGLDKKIKEQLKEIGELKKKLISSNTKLNKDFLEMNPLKDRFRVLSSENRELKEKLKGRERDVRKMYLNITSREKRAKEKTGDRDGEYLAQIKEYRDGYEKRLREIVNKATKDKLELSSYIEKLKNGLTRRDQMIKEMLKNRERMIGR